MRFPLPFAELPVEARALLFIIALAAVASCGAQPPEQSELTSVLETIWNGNRLRLKDLSDPFRMTALLKTELASVFLPGIRNEHNKNCAYPTLPGRASRACGTRCLRASARSGCRGQRRNARSVS